MAKFHERRASVKSFHEEAEPLEHGAIAELIAIGDQLLVIAVGALEIGLEAIRDLLNAAAKGGIVEHVDNRPVNIGDGHLCVVAPDWFCAEDFFRLQVLQSEVEALPLLVPLADGLSRYDHDVFENLLGQIPMLRGGAAGDVAGREQRRHEHPGIIENPFRPERVDRRRDIGARPDSAQPSLLTPTREALGGFGSRLTTSAFATSGDVDHIASSGETCRS